MGVVEEITSPKMGDIWNVLLKAFPCRTRSSAYASRSKPQGRQKLSSTEIKGEEKNHTKVSGGGPSWNGQL